METGKLFRTERSPLFLICALMLALAVLPAMAIADTLSSMQNYCSVPPLPGLGVKPNLLILLDNSSSMYDLAYTDSSTHCLDDSFKPDGNYLGYFDQGTVYRYVFAMDGTGSEAGRFVPAGSGVDSGSCGLVRTDDVCVNLNADSQVDNFRATGKFLNWLAMSKLDIEKMALTGGKYDTSSGTLQAESRGCQGKRFVKMLGNERVAFGVRGPVSSESGYTAEGDHGGPTRIDVYARRYNKEDCLAAVSAWQQGAQVEELSLKASACLGPEFEPDGTTVSKGKIYSEVMSFCYLYLAGTDTYSQIRDTLLSDCKNRYVNRYNNQPIQIIKNTGDDVCGRGLFHSLIKRSDGISYTSGYLGQCYGEGTYNPSCAQNQAKDFCVDIEKPYLFDPSVTVTQAGTNANLPGFILDAGVNSMGSIAGTLLARVETATEPKGLIQQFANDINFGAMTFSYNGSKSECGSTVPCISHCTNVNIAPNTLCQVNKDCDNGTMRSGTCVADTFRDGGRIVSHLNSDPVGSHAAGSGLVATIDAVKATSWTPLAEAMYQAIGYFSGREALQLDAADFDLNRPPSQFSCQKNHVVIVTDGISTADRNGEVLDFVQKAVSDWVNQTDLMPASQTTSRSTLSTADPQFLGSYNVDDLAWIARHKNIYDPAQPIRQQRDYITTHVVYTGAPCGNPQSETVPKTGYNADGTCVTTDEGVPEKAMQLVAEKGGGSIKNIGDQAGLAEAMQQVFQQVRTGSSSGTGSSILATGEGNGALFLQAQYYPSKSFDGGVTSTTWIGEIKSLWYSIDSFIGTTGAWSTIREDSDGSRGLELKTDKVVQFGYDAASGEAVAELLVDANGDGKPDVPQPTGFPKSVAPEKVQSLWRAGLQLWQREPSERTIYTQTDGKNLVKFLDTAQEGNRQLLMATDKAEADGIVAFVKGSDELPATRDRSVATALGGNKRVWKLGDIISSTPVLQTPVPLGSYHLPLPSGYGDTSYDKFIKSNAYLKTEKSFGRGTVYLGANDGMLHAFRLGRLRRWPVGDEDWPADKKVVLEGEDLGKEEWAFIPKNALPYLKYLKEPLYSHLYYVDGSTTLVDASLGDPTACSRDGYWECPKNEDSWRTLLVGSMGLGGASRGPDADCVEGANGTCVKAPMHGVGLSSYFALDVTEQQGDGKERNYRDKVCEPKLLWEFSHPRLGFSTSGAAVLRIKARTALSPPATGVIHDPDKNGRWFAVFASGPTGPVDKSARQFLGKSDQNLFLFVVDLNAAPPLREGLNYWVIDSKIEQAFGGSIAGGGIDTDRWNSGKKSDGQYEDDALYVGYTRRADNGSWTGGLLRLLTREDPDPSKWEVRKVIDDIGPVTGGIAKLQDRNARRLWLYFGTGRYFHNRDEVSVDRRLFAVSDPCYVENSIAPDDKRCTPDPALALKDLTNVTDPDDIVPAEKISDPTYHGWMIDLDRSAGALGSERVTTTPAALTSGAVIFTTFKPAVDACIEGTSYLWGVKYDTGGAASALNGKALVPLSNGSSSGIDFSSFTEKGGRRSPPLPGKAEKPKVVTNSGLKPIKKIIHMQER